MAVTIDGTANTITAAATSATALTTASGSAPSYSARAWVNFNGTGTIAIRASGNVTSITDNGVGDYTVNFTTAMADVNYASMGCFRWDEAGGAVPAIWLQLSRNAQTTSAVRFQASVYTGGLYDGTTVTVAIFR